ncbi:hypothetical protein [Leptospira borgpetersenii]|uniref:hypothetical protein n=1 Tax=Leptospira borgpetersenii TaxID=174 RepID=UPI000AF457D1|nr:hypothetical protein [Leptospira borgpetersenii]MBE8398650.1 hypothetical protein [Leptospira borgpetersenii serovar Tarassovi]MBE8405836.1 hypothetical protein [Leptospira borgpetersenii serovar Tarassovi]MBE8412156.1 hypothetical protein [Leptospira borgpetersenii serovar Tarassovi]MBE8414208.1 hypothetical protein [Leptospira borgpetersenii serovar Tarassovi]MBE8435683.1 hypothetical protein [Leptospira borgpetersenii serovar Tarassovi]
MLRVIERKFHRRFSKDIQCDISNVIVFSVSIKGSRTLIALGVFNKLSTSAPGSLACADFSRKHSDTSG